jgi:hypothetical protein
MLVALLIKTLVVGFVDSINQTTFVITIYLLSTRHPIKLTLFFILGIIFSFSLVGFIVYLGLGQFFFKIFTFSKNYEAWIGLFFGCAIITIPFFYNANKSKQPKIPALDHPFKSLFLGAGLTLAQIPVTIPFLFLMQHLAHKVDIQALPIFLITFDLIVTLPLWVLLGAYILFHERAKPFLKYVDFWVNKNTQSLLKFMLFLFGLFVILNATSFLFGKPLLPIYGN